MSMHAGVGYPHAPAAAGHDAVGSVCEETSYHVLVQVSDRPEGGSNGDPASDGQPGGIARSGTGVARGGPAGGPGPRHVPVPDTGDSGDGGEVERDAQPVVVGERQDVGQELPCLAEGPEE